MRLLFPSRKSLFIILLSGELGYGWSYRFALNWLLWVAVLSAVSLFLIVTEIIS